MTVETPRAAPGAGRREAVGWRICHRAQQLADEHGFDGFTLEDLSRRTLFNYFPGKVDAVLGPGPELDDESLAAFRAGGPHHDLVEDLAVLARTVLSEKVVTRADLAVHRRLLRANPRLLAAAHERFQVLCEHLVDEILTRESPHFDAARARIAVRLLVAVTDTALERFVDGSDDQSFADLFTDSLRTARELFG